MKYVKYVLLGMIVCFLLGCSDKGVIAETYTMKKVVPAGVEGVFNCVALGEDKVYLNSYVWDEDTEEYSARLYCLNDQQDPRLDFNSINITSNDADGIIALDEKGFLQIGHEMGQESSFLAKYVLDIPTSKETIVLGGIYIDQEVVEQAYAFNNSNEEYEIQIKDYAAGNEDLGLDEILNQLNADIVKGKQLDIISLGFLPVEAYVEKGVLLNLTTYIDGDPEIAEEDFVPAVREAMRIRGGIYYIAPSFSPSAMVVKKKMVGAETELTVKKLYELWEEKKRPCIMSASPNIALHFMLTHLLDEEEINNEDLQMILEMCSYAENKKDNLSECMEQDQVLFCPINYNGPLEMEVMHSIFNDDITIIGYPGSEDASVYVQFPIMLGITTTSGNKEAAYQFVSGILSEDNQEQGKLVPYYPVRQEAFDHMITQLEDGLSENGTSIVGETWERFGITGAYDKLTKEDSRMIYEMVNSVSKVDYDDAVLYDLIGEESAPYFNGDKSLESVINSMQNRLKLYYLETN